MKHLKPSATGIISSAAIQMRKEGIHVYNFAAGDPVLPNHPAILEAAKAAIDEKMSPYAPIAGLIELRKAAADWMNRRYQCNYSNEETVVTAGGKFGIYAALQILLEEGEEAVILAPYWVSYPEMFCLAHGKPVIVPTSEETHWKTAAEQIKAHLTEKTRVLILNNACNPTGALYTRQEIADILSLAKTHNLTVISDEVYSEIVYDDAHFVSCASFPEYKSRVLIIESCSKNFGMAGWRVGFAFGPKELITNLVALQSQSTTGTSLASQKAALGALKDADRTAAYVRNAMLRRRNLFFETFNRLFKKNVKPVSSTLYYFAKIDGDSMTACREILEKAHAALVPGTGFGLEGYLRFAFSEEEKEIVKGLEALKKIHFI